MRKDRIPLKESSGKSRWTSGLVLTLFFLPFICVPFLPTILDGKPPIWPLMIFPGIALPILLFILYQLFRETGLDVDLDSGVLIKWTKSPGGENEERFPLSNFELVSLEKRIVTTNSGPNNTSSSKTVYPVRLKGQTDLGLGQFDNSFQARALAEKTAKLLEVDLVDSSSGVKVVREHDKLDETVGERLLRLDTEVSLQAPPAGSELNLESTSEAAVLNLSQLGLQGSAIALLVPFVLFAAFGGHIFMGETVVLLAVGGPLLFVGIGVLVQIVHHCFSRRTLLVTPGDVILQRKSALRRSEDSIPLNELEEVLCAPDKIILKSDKKQVNIDFRSQEEIAWVKSTLDYLLKGMAGQVS